jgi:hypothetical protein
MKVVVTLTVTGDKETMLEGYARFGGSDVLEQRGIGFWLHNYRFVGPGGKRYRKGRVFCPWTSVLMAETEDEAQEQVHQTR